MVAQVQTLPSNCTPFRDVIEQATDRCVLALGFSRLITDLMKDSGLARSRAILNVPQKGLWPTPGATSRVAEAKRLDNHGVLGRR